MSYRQFYFVAVEAEKKKKERQATIDEKSGSAFNSKANKQKDDKIATSEKKVSQWRKTEAERLEKIIYSFNSTFL